MGQEMKLDNLFSEGSKVNYISFTPTGGWCILVGSNGYWYSSIPQAAIDKLSELHENKSTINSIAFSNDGGWVIIYDTYGYWYHNIPQSAKNKIKELNKNKKEIKQVAFTSSGGWCILVGKNGYWYDNIPQAAIDKLASLHEREVQITDIAFTPTGGWCIIQGSNGYWYQYIPQPAKDKLSKLNGAKKTIKKIAFNSTSSFIFYDDTYWTGLNEKQVVAYNYAPEIKITSPILTRGFKVIQSTSVWVEGRATDSDGISSVTVNGNRISVKSDGYFSTSVSLSSGDNIITVRAVDTKMKSSTETFTVNRKVEVVNNYTSNEKRVALVFGNSNYTNAASLGANPINDAKDIASTLRTMGFNVIVKTNATLTTMNNAIREFGRQNRDADVALFYFAGHGMQLEEINYLLPVSAKIKDKNDVSFESISVATVQKIMETSNSARLNLIILDACRNNPFRTWERGGETGLSGMTPPSGTLIAFSTSPGSTASNGNTRNGLYTGELIKQLKIPQRIEDVFINTRVAVENKSGGQQSPWELARLRGKYFLVK